MSHFQYFLHRFAWDFPGRTRVLWTMESLQATGRTECGVTGEITIVWGYNGDIMGFMVLMGFMVA